ncbi:MAG: AAA family ATPase [Candidatus Promineifilaceae bacterium]
MPMDIQRAVQVIDSRLPRVEHSYRKGSLLILAGLPGVGKSMIAENLQQLIPCAVVSSDLARKLVVERPVYTEDEMRFVYMACWLVIERRLRQGQRVVFDASNRSGDDRRHVMAIARSLGAPAVLCHIVADENVVRQRLLGRISGSRRSGDMSDAGIEPFLWMKDVQDPIDDPSLTLDSTNSPPEVLARVVRDYWLLREKNVESHSDRQS